MAATPKSPCLSSGSEEVIFNGFHSTAQVNHREHHAVQDSFSRYRQTKLQIRKQSPMFSFGGRRQNGGVGTAKPQCRRNPPLLLRSPRDGIALMERPRRANQPSRRSKSCFCVPVVMPGAQFLSFRLPSFRFMRPSSLLHGSSRHQLDESNRRILADLSWAPFLSHASTNRHAPRRTLR